MSYFGKLITILLLDDIAEGVSHEKSPGSIVGRTIVFAECICNAGRSTDCIQEYKDIDL